MGERRSSLVQMQSCSCHTVAHESLLCPSAETLSKKPTLYCTSECSIMCRALCRCGKDTLVNMADNLGSSYIPHSIGTAPAKTPRRCHEVHVHALPTHELDLPAPQLLRSSKSSLGVFLRSAYIHLWSSVAVHLCRPRVAF